MSRPFPSRSSSGPNSQARVNGKIRAREVRVIGQAGQQLGILSLGDAINMARTEGVDLVEIAPNATPPVCRLVDFGKYRYEQNKRDKEAKRHQHANKVKEIQLSPGIDPHDLGVKLAHAIDFLCEEMKVKVALKFRGREMAHQEIGFQQIEKFTQALAPYGHPDNQARVVGRGIIVMFSPLPRNKRAKNPHEAAPGGQPDAHSEKKPKPSTSSSPDKIAAQGSSAPDFQNNPFTGIDIHARDEESGQAGGS